MRTAEQYRRCPSPSHCWASLAPSHGLYLEGEMTEITSDLKVLCFCSVQLLSRVRLFATPWTVARQASLSTTNSRSPPKPMSIELVMPSNHLILCRLLLLLPSIFPNIIFQMSQFFPAGGQSIGVSASALVLPMHTQDWSPLGWTDWISLQSKGLSRVFSNTTVQKHQFFSAHLSLYSNSHIHTWLLGKPYPWLDGPLLAK